MALNCPAVRELLQDYLTRDLPPAQRSLVDSHLLECEACRQELALVGLVVSGLSTQKAAEPPAGFTERVLAGLPARSRFAVSPWWSLALAPLLAGLSYLARRALIDGLVDVARWFGLDVSQLGTVRVPDVSGISAGQLGLYALVSTVVLIGLFGLGVTACWKWYSEGR